MSDIIEQLSNRSGECVKMSCRHYLDTISGENDGSYCGKYEDKPNICNHIDTINRSPEVFDMMLEALLEECNWLIDSGVDDDEYTIKIINVIEKATGKNPWEE